MHWFEKKSGLMRFKLLITSYLVRIQWENFWYRNNFKRLRERKYKTLIGRLKASAFYAKLAASPSMLTDFPIMNKASFMQHFDDINTVDISLKEASNLALKAENERNFSPTINGITVGLSTGTSGNRGIFLASEKERALWVAYILNRVIGFSFTKRKVAFFLRANSNLYESVRSNVLEFSFFDLMMPMENNLERLQDFGPDIVVAPPSVLLQIAKFIENEGLQMNAQKVISVAEVLYPEDKAYLERILKQTIHQVYQCTEGFLAATCKNGTLHMNEDFLIIEKKYLDEEKTRFHPIITDLHRQSQPIIRYELNDILVEKQSCPCDSSKLAIEAIEGRSDDILVFENEAGKLERIFPDFFRRAIVFSAEQISNYMLIQKQKNQLHLYIGDEPEVNFPKATSAIENFLEKRKISGVEIIQISEPKSEQGSKLRRIKNESSPPL